MNFILLALADNTMAPAHTTHNHDVLRSISHNLLVPPTPTLNIETELKNLLKNPMSLILEAVMTVEIMLASPLLCTFTRRMTRRLARDGIINLKIYIVIL